MYGFALSYGVRSSLLFGIRFVHIIRVFLKVSFALNQPSGATGKAFQHDLIRWFTTILFSWPADERGNLGYVV
jgi:hypothetical protein